MYPPTNQNYIVTAPGYQDASGICTIDSNISGPVILRLIPNSSVPFSQWISVGLVRSPNYYLSLLQANDTSPYVQLSEMLANLPDTPLNATAVAQIYYLAMNSTNPETKEAFELLVKGGTANQMDFTYPIPQYNTELRVLYWLASERELKKDDTLALAISMSNGLWVTIGDDSVQAKVKSDVVDLLDFFRETDSMQAALGYARLEQLPLEAMVALAWLGGDTGTHGPHGITGPQILYGDARSSKMNLAGYEWDNVEVATLRAMRDYMEIHGWLAPSLDETVKNLECYFYTCTPRAFDYVSSSDVKIQVDGETVPSRNIDNANFEYQYYLENGVAIGVCEDEMTLVSAFLKSWGIPTLAASYYWTQGNWYNGHTNTMYYDASSKTWKVNVDQIDIVYADVRDAYVFIPPVLQNEWLPFGVEGAPSKAAVPYPYQDGEVNAEMFAPMYNITGAYLDLHFITGIATAQMKQWILYKATE